MIIHGVARIAHSEFCRNRIEAKVLRGDAGRAGGAREQSAGGPAEADAEREAPPPAKPEGVQPVGAEDPAPMDIGPGTENVGGAASASDANTQMELEPVKGQKWRASSELIQEEKI